MKKIKVLVLILYVLLISGCVPFLLTNVVIGSVLISQDRRSVGEILDDKTLLIFLKEWALNNEVLETGHVNFAVYNRAVLITGEVASARVKKNIETVIRSKRPDIAYIYNELYIAPNTSLTTRLNDNKIKVEIKLLYYNQEVFYPSHVLVHVENGVVYLMGALTTREENKAVKEATKVSSVKSIVKLFEHLEKRPQREIERDREHREEVIKKEEIAQKKAILLRERDAVQQQIDDLE